MRWCGPNRSLPMRKKLTTKINIANRKPGKIYFKRIISIQTFRRIDRLTTNIFKSIP